MPGREVGPDRAEALRGTHEAAAYEGWFLERVEEAIREADNPNAVSIPDEVIKGEMARERAELLALLKNEGK
ncbi:hypothetical protein [Rhizobium aouanii]|uniref:Stability determinant n=1 Tax=Rhizobium aouanii TaxID=3118145 RepID=A0ABU8CGX9_9HYPH